MTAHRITTLLLFLAVGALGVAAFLCASCAPRMRDGSPLPLHHPAGQTLEDWRREENVWPQGCGKLDRHESEFPKLTDDEPRDPEFWKKTINPL